MRPPSILDVVRAVKKVGAARDDVTGWWYAPPKRLRLSGERPEERYVEVAVEGDLGPGAGDAIARELSSALGGAAVRVRPYRGGLQDAHLYRLLSARGTLRAS
jgi:hypothetical protein